MQVEVKGINELRKSDVNVRFHSDKQLKEYIRSIEMFGQIRPLVVDEKGVVLAGNGLYEALKMMGRETADCYVVTNLSETQKKKLMLADNKVYELGMDDHKSLEIIIKELQGDVDVPGYDEDLLRFMTQSATKAVEEALSYGSFSANQVESMQNRQTSYYANEENNVKNDTLMANPTPTPTQNETTPVAVPVSTPQPTVEVNRQQFVICPKCGEKIWL